MPDRVEPMLVTPARAIPVDDDRYAFEVKYDGYRAIAFARDGAARFQSRNVRDLTGLYPELVPTPRQLRGHQLVLDGEVIVAGEGGRSDFEALQLRSRARSASAIVRHISERPAAFMVFDLLWSDGRSLLSTSYEERRAKLEALEINDARWQAVGINIGRGVELLAASREHRLEGLVAKRLGSRYEPGRRSAAWLKIKNWEKRELAVGAWLPDDGGIAGWLGGLVVGDLQADGRLVYAGVVDVGLRGPALRFLREALPMLSGPNPFVGWASRRARYVLPKILVEVQFLDRGRGALDHASVRGVRVAA